MKYLGEQIMEEQGFCELSFSFFHIENCCLLVGTKVKSNIKETVYWNERSNTFLQSVIANQFEYSMLIIIYQVYQSLYYICFIG